MEIVSEPTFDTDGDGVTDTYGKNETVRFRVTFSEAMNVTGTPQLSFKLDPNYAAKQANYESGSGTSLLTFAFNVQPWNNTPTGIEVLANTLALNGGTITTVAGGVAADLAHAGLSADPNHKVNAPNHDANAAPALRSATVTGTTLKLAYYKVLDTGSTPAAGDFTIRVAGSTANLAAANPVTVSGSTVTLTLASAPDAGQSVTVSYTAGTNPIQDKAGNDAANLSNHAVVRPAPTVESVEIVSVPAVRRERPTATAGHLRPERESPGPAHLQPGGERDRYAPADASILNPAHWGAFPATYHSGQRHDQADLRFHTVTAHITTRHDGVAGGQANTLALNGGTINAAVGTGIAADLAHAGLPAQPEPQGGRRQPNSDTTPLRHCRPQPMKGAALTLTYNEALDTFSVPATRTTSL